jgi:hypothetical protein
VVVLCRSAKALEFRVQAALFRIADAKLILPNRFAYVRSAEAGGEVYTQDTSPHVTGAELTARVQQLRVQTRARYCHPRAEIEHPAQATAQTTRAPGPAAAHQPRFTRSEEVP